MKNPDIKMMFETIADGYDFQNRFLSLRTDRWWRRMMVRNIECPHAGMVLDVATGTAEIALQIIRQRPEMRVVGIDFSPNMVNVGLRKVKKAGREDKITLMIGDARKLPVKSSQFDVVTIAFGIRNIKERGEVLAMFREVLKPGGQLMVMEFGLPQTPLLRQAYRYYFDRILPFLGDTISRTGFAYTYLARSVHQFPLPHDFVRLIERSGFEEVRIQKLTFGIALLFMAKKPL